MAQPRAAQFEQLLAVLRVLGDDMLLPVGDPHIVFGVNEDSVRLGELTLTPGGNEVARIRLKGDDRVFVAAENKNPIA